MSWEARCLSNDRGTPSSTVSCQFMLCQEKWYRSPAMPIIEVKKSCNLGRSEIRLQIDQALIGIRLDSHLTLKWITWANTLDRWSNIGTEVNIIFTSIGMEIPCFQNDETSSDEHIARPAHAGQRGFKYAKTRSWRLHVNCWEVVQRFKAPKTYSKLYKALCKTMDTPQISRL